MGESDAIKELRGNYKRRANEKVVKKCRRCGNTFEEKRLSPIKVEASNESYVGHRYCPRCRWLQKRAARACDPRYVGVGGHGDILEAGR